jgi:hypothetical protein
MLFSPRLSSVQQTPQLASVIRPGCGRQVTIVTNSEQTRRAAVLLQKKWRAPGDKEYASLLTILLGDLSNGPGRAQVVNRSDAHPLPYRNQVESVDPP